MNSRRVLIIHKSMEARQFLELAFRISIGCSVYGASSSLEVFELIKSMQFDLIISTFSPSQREGASIIRALFEVQSQAKIILFFGYDSPQEVEIGGHTIPILPQHELIGLLEKSMQIKSWSRRFQSMESIT